MSQIIRVGFITIGLLLVPVGRVAQSSDLPEPTSQDERYASRLVFDAALKLANQYRALPVGGTIANPKVEVDCLVTHLSTLVRLDPVIRKRIGPAIGDDWRKSDIRRNRALAWLHAWAISGRLAVEAGHSGGAAEFRATLLGGIPQKNGPSALELLMLLYEQILCGEGKDAIDPLRTILNGSLSFSTLLSYRVSWGDIPSDRRGGVTHDYFIPATIDLVLNQA